MTAARFIDVAVLALYAPIIFFSGRACLLYFFRVLIPAIRAHQFSLERHAVALSAVAALLAHFSENVFYGITRMDKSLDFLADKLEYVGLMKLVVLFSSILAVAVYNKAVFGSQNLFRLNAQALLLWLVAFIILCTVV